MAVNREIWEASVKEVLFADNAFLNAFNNRDENVVGGAIVHIPQAGAASPVVRNRSSLPAAVTVRTDTDITYALDEFTSDPIKLSDRERVELSYDKMASFIRQDTGNLMEVMAEWMLYNASKEALADSKVASTGADSAATVAGATGTRKILTPADLLKAQTILNTQNVPQNDRALILDANQLAQLVGNDKLYDSYERTASRTNGTLPMLYGFNIYMRSTALRLDASQAVKAPGAAEVATDTSGALFFQKSFIDRAIGTIRVFDNFNDPTYYGDIISFLIRAQATHNREDKKGFGIIYNAA